ncbi:MAG: benzoate-CoA ligase family protein [Myxococcales bacterium]|nr:benzoate-CoA ligase family protein [Myxococcales bacterium]
MDLPRAFNLASYYLFDRLAEGKADDTAILFGAERHSYSEVAARTRELARYFIAAGVAQEQRALVVLPDTPAFAWAFFAALRAGLVVAMGNPAAPAADLAYLVRYTRASAVVTTPGVAACLAATLGETAPRALVLAREVATGEDVRAAVEIGPELAALGAISLASALERGRAGSGPSERATERDDPAIWLFTSGSTGQPKAAMHAHRDFAFHTERYALGTVGYRAGDVTVSVPRLFFGYATGTNLMFPFRVGATAALFAERATPETLAWAIERYRPTIVTNVPTMMAKLLDDDDARARKGQARLDMSCVRFHLSAGEALPPALYARFVARFGGEVYDGIGSAEMFHIYCSNRPGDVRPGSLGRVVDGYEIRLLPADATEPCGAEVATGESGVMWVKGDSVAFGYFQERERSWQTFHGHYCRTGDLFRRDADGYYWFEGRADELLKVGGIWVAPVEVEACLCTHPEVSAAAVIGREEEGLVKPKAFVVLRAPERHADAAARAALAAELKGFVQQRLSKHKYPRWVAIVPELPRNDRGKTDRKSLRERDRAGELPVGD